MAIQLIDGGWGKAAKLATNWVAGTIAAAGATWLTLPPEAQTAVLLALGVKGIGVTLIGAGVSVIAARMLKQPSLHQNEAPADKGPQ